MVKEEAKSLEDEIIELGEESLQKDKQPEPPVDGQKERGRQRDRRPRKKPRPPTIPTKWGTTSCSA